MIIIDLDQARRAKAEGRPVMCEVAWPPLTVGDVEAILLDVLEAIASLPPVAESALPVCAADLARAGVAAPWWDLPPTSRRDRLRLYVRQCGYLLHDAGGMPTMLAAWELVSAAHGPKGADIVDRAWDRVGDWIA